MSTGLTEIGGPMQEWVEPGDVYRPGPISMRAALSMPGIPWIYAGLTILFLIGARKLLFIWGINIPQRGLAQVGGSLGTVLFVWGVYAFNRAHMTATLLRPAHLLKVNLWRGLLVVLFGFGVIRGNFVTDAGNELIMLWIFSSALVIGGDDRFWYAIEKPLTIFFYIAAILVYVYSDTTAPVTGYTGTTSEFVEYASARFLGTMGAELRPYTGAGMFLGLWGMIRPQGGLWRLLQIAAFFVAFYIEVGLFKFRGGAVSFGLVGLSFLLARPLLEYRKRPGATALLLAAGIIALLVFLRTEAAQILLQRFEQTSRESIFASRMVELSAYTDEMGLEVLIGRGLGGTFNAHQVYSSMEASVLWGTLHFGLLAFTLKGGIFMLGLFLAILLPGFFLRRKAWYQNPCNLAAALFFPILLLQFAFGPFALSPGSIMIYLPAMMVIARFGRFNELDYV